MINLQNTKVNYTQNREDFLVSFGNNNICNFYSYSELSNDEEFDRNNIYDSDKYPKYIHDVKGDNIKSYYDDGSNWRRYWAWWGNNYKNNII